MANKASKESKLSRFLKAPLRILMKARDFYIQSLVFCDGQMGYGSVAMGCPTSQITTLPKSFSVNSSKSNEDFRELVRVASTRGLGNKVEVDLQKRRQLSQASRGNNNMPRSYSVGIGRIDEDMPCEFGDEKMKTNFYPRSRSYAVSRRNSIGMF